MDENQKFQEIANSGLEEYFNRNPRIAVNFGKEGYEKKLESATKEHIEENLKWFGHWVDQFKQLKFESLNFENKISLKAIEYYHKINLFMHKAFPLWKKIPNGLEYFQEIIFLLFQRKGATKEVAEAIIYQLANLPKYLNEFQSRFDDTPIPLVWRDLALEQTQTLPEFLCHLGEAFKELSGLDENIKKQLYNMFKKSETIIKTHIEWIKNLPVDDGEFAWALGTEKFDEFLSLKKLPWDRKTLIRKGGKLFNSYYKRLTEMGNKIYPNKSLGEAIQTFFKEDRVSNFQEVLDYTQKEAQRAKEFVKLHELATIPQESLIIVKTPPHLVSTIPSAAYFEPPYFTKDKQGLFLMTPELGEENLTSYSYSAISNTVVHEAYPGHHTDFVCNNAFAPILRLLGVALETVEGWAHYCEEMMLQQGFHEKSEKAGLLVLGGQLFRAIRLNLDIQLHCKQRTIQEAIQMLMNTLQMGEKEAKVEVLRYTSTPTYQLSYLIGKLLIEDIRTELEKTMGNKFNLKLFHDIILNSGDLPYFLLKEYIEEKMKIKRCRIIKDYITPFSEPLILEKGEMIKVEEKECEWLGWIWGTTNDGKSGWVPKNYLSIEGEEAKMVVDYDATELKGFKGQEFIIEKEESGWVWVISESGEKGWIPLENIELIE